MELLINDTEDLQISLNEKAIHDLIMQLNLQLDILSIHYLTDDALLEINKEYLNHDYYTDIITFDLRDSFTNEAELYISIDRVKENASINNVLFDVELARVITHGLLHLSGYSDSTQEEKDNMRSMEDKYLKLLFHVKSL